MYFILSVESFVLATTIGVNVFPQYSAYRFQYSFANCQNTFAPPPLVKVIVGSASTNTGNIISVPALK